MSCHGNVRYQNAAIKPSVIQKLVFHFELKDKAAVLGWQFGFCYHENDGNLQQKAVIPGINQVSP